MISREEAIKELEFRSQITSGVFHEALDMAIEALEKRIPKKPIAVDWSEEFEGALIEDKCPICGNYVHCLENFCTYCGQSIDWSGDDD